MRVLNHNFRCIDHAETMVSPAVAKLTVFAGSVRKISVKAFDCPEQVCRHSQVVGGKKSWSVGHEVIVFVKVIDEQLTGG